MRCTNLILGTVITHIREIFESSRTRMKGTRNNTTHFAKHLKDSNHKFDIHKAFNVLYFEGRNNHIPA